MSAQPRHPDSPHAAAGPLDENHLRQIEEARHRARKVRRAAAYASFSAWTLAISAATALLSGIFSTPALVAGIGLAAAAFFEFKGRAGLLRFEPRSLTLLALNQALVVAVVVMYCAIQIWTAAHPDAASRQTTGDAGADRILRDVEEFAKLVRFGIYSAVAGSCVIFQGLAAIYYHTRKRHVAAYLAQTPAWIITLDKSRRAA